MRMVRRPAVVERYMDQLEVDVAIGQGAQRRARRRRYSPNPPGPFLGSERSPDSRGRRVGVELLQDQEERGAVALEPCSSESAWSSSGSGSVCSSERASRRSADPPRQRGRLAAAIGGERRRDRQRRAADDRQRQVVVGGVCWRNADAARTTSKRASPASGAASSASTPAPSPNFELDAPRRVFRSGLIG